MKKIGRMSPDEIAGLVCETLGQAGITVTLTGGACVAIWSRGKYVSEDLDFIEEGPVSRRRIIEAMGALGFEVDGRIFVHRDTNVYVEFPTGPLMVGDERVLDVATRETVGGQLRLLKPTDCVKDRLAAYFHWNDKQALEQAVMVAKDQGVDMKDLRRWSEGEGAVQKFEAFRKRLRQRRE